MWAQKSQPSLLFMTSRLEKSRLPVLLFQLQPRHLLPLSRCLFLTHLQPVVVVSLLQLRQLEGEVRLCLLWHSVICPRPLLRRHHLLRLTPSALQRPILMKMADCHPYGNSTAWQLLMPHSLS